MNKCICRQCSKVYDPQKSRAEYRGYCSQKCLHLKSKALGWRKGQKEVRKGYGSPQPVSEYDVLHRAGQGSEMWYRK